MIIILPTPPVPLVQITGFHLELLLGSALLLGPAILLRPVILLLADVMSWEVALEGLVLGGVVLLPGF